VFCITDADVNYASPLLCSDNKLLRESSCEVAIDIYCWNHVSNFSFKRLMSLHRKYILL